MPDPTLADQLYLAGLAPQGTERCENGTAYRNHNIEHYWWRPETCLCCVAHLIERFAISLEPYVPPRLKGRWLLEDYTAFVGSEDAATFADVPATVARIALRCMQKQQE